MDKINCFEGEYRFLSNFYSLMEPIVYEQIEYSTVEHAYQAAKTTDIMKRVEIASAETPGVAKRMGRTVKLRKDWDFIKLDIMRQLLGEKFKGFLLRSGLLATKNAMLIEGNWWCDNYWGVCGCDNCDSGFSKGQNYLGKLLMELREELREGNNNGS
jgi:ribA/ribD-fused uncharacterized protein